MMLQATRCVKPQARCRLSGEAAHHEGGVLAAEAEAGGDRDLDGHLARGVRHVIEIAGRITLRLVDRRRNGAAVKRHGQGHGFEVVQKISAKAKSKCPTCGARASRIISGGAALIFKGTGFYITDYGKDGKGPRKDAGADAPKAEAAPTPAASADAAPKASTEPPAKPKKKAEKAAE